MNDLKSAKAATSLCSFCPKLCHHACPVSGAEQTEATTPWGKMSVMKYMDEGVLPKTADNMALAYKCLGCRSSEEDCQIHTPVPESLNTYRNQAFEKNLAPESITTYCQKFQKQNNPFDQDLLSKLQKQFPKQLERKPVTYFPGCTEIEKDPKNIRETFKLFEKIGADVGLYPESFQCCGYPLYAAGDWKNFRELAEINTHLLENYPTLVSSAPACLHTMQNVYREFGFSPKSQFLHITEFLEQKMPMLPMPKNDGEEPRKVAYHDPCYLGRYRGIYEAPRKLIEKISGDAPKEFARNGAASYCSGSGGLLPVTSPETAAKITESRLEEYRETKAEVLVSGCPTCVQRFRKFGVDAKNLVTFIQEEYERKT